MSGWMKRFLAAGALFLPMAGCIALADTLQTADDDILLRGGTVYSGNADPFVGDIAIKGDRIVYAGPHSPGGAKRVIDATGFVVAPGFIDPHAHVDFALASSDPASRLVLPFLMQGVTTAFIGVDGYGSPDIKNTLKQSAAAEAGSPLASTKQDAGINYAAYVGLGAVRLKVIGSEARVPTNSELQQMTGLVAHAMCEGAIGFSTGLFYAPQSYAKTDEVVELAKAAAIRGGIYDSHIRDESSYSIGLSSAIDEVIAIGRDADIPVHISHIKALGVDVWGQAPDIIAKIEAARANGQVVTANQYPWAASGTSLSAALIPRWAQDGGRSALLDRFNDAAVMVRMRQEIAENLRRRGGPASLLITSGPESAEGKTLEAIATDLGLDPIDAAISILQHREAVVASFNQNEDDIAAFMKQPWVVTSSDASLGHPRYYASFARKYATYVRDRQTIDMRAFIDRSTAVTAEMFGLEDRGHLSEGARADVVVFDPEAFAPRADYAHPFLFSRGVRTVIVNGGLAIDEGEPTGVAAGRPLLGKPPVGTCD